MITPLHFYSFWITEKRIAHRKAVDKLLAALVVGYGCLIQQFFPHPKPEFDRLPER
jgi:hypothetical protein